jgi:hypothetical protein
MKIKILLSIFLIISLFISCSDDDSPTTPTQTNYLFKATFINDWLPAESGQAIIFLSDEDGNVLAEKTWSGNDSFEMYLDDGLNKSVTNNITQISVTTVTQNGITTNLNIPVGSSWTWKGYPSADYDNPYTVELDFQNVPEYEDYYVISSKWNSIVSRSSELVSPFNYSFYESPTDIYVKLNTINNGVRYLWLNGVVGGSRQDDLTNMNPALSQTINLQGNTNGYRKSLYGIANSGNRYEGRYRLDYGRDYNPASSVTVYYPQSSFTDYRTSITYYEELYKSEWYQSTYGEIPNAFTKINASFDFLNTSLDNFEISASGDFTQYVSIWESDGYTNLWSIYGGKEVTKYKLPVLPNSVSQLFNVDRSSFKLWLADLLYYPGLSSYEDVLNILFNSPNYFYDVVNELRRYTKYSPDGLLKLGGNKSLAVKLHKEPYLN